MILSTEPTQGVEARQEQVTETQPSVEVKKEEQLLTPNINQNEAIDENVREIGDGQKDGQKGDVSQEAKSDVQKGEEEVTQGGVTAPSSEQKSVTQQIEDFGVAREDAKSAETLLDRVFKGLKNAGLTTAKTLGDWVGIGKGKERAESLKTVNLPNGQTGRVIMSDVVDGFYSNAENALAQVKQEKMSGNQWKQQLLSRGAKAEEMKWTTLADFLEANKDKSITKSDIEQYLKDNRIEIREVVKGEDSKKVKELLEKRNALYVKTGDIEKRINSELGKGVNGVDINVVNALMLEKNNTQKEFEEADKEFNLAKNNDTNFSQYQLEGEKENYKEVLVILPSDKKSIFLKTGGTIEFEKNQFGGAYVVRRNGKELYRTLTESDAINKLPKPTETETKFGADFKSSHFDEPNILVHLRMNTRTDAEGNKVLFLEEVQSDWGQKGKKEGFKLETPKEKIKAVGVYNNLINQKKKILENATDYVLKNKIPELQKEVDLINDKIESAKKLLPTEAVIDFETEFANIKVDKNIPPAPFVTDTNAWVKLGLKFAIKEAIAQGVDRMAWTTGEQQNERYSLDKYADEVRYKKNSNGSYNVVAFKGGENISEGKNLNEKQLEERLGKDVAKRIIDGIGENIEGEKSLTGLDLKVEGRGMKAFYGVPSEGNKGIVGKVAEALVKELAGKEAKIGDLQLQTTKGAKSDNSILNFRDWVWKNKTDDFSYNDAKKEIDDNGKLYQEYKKNTPTQHFIEITPELKAEVQRGQPLFKDANAQYRLENNKNLIEALKDFDGSPEAVVALTHEIMHPTVVEIINGAQDGNKEGLRHTKTIIDEYNKANPKNKVTQEELIADNDKFKNGTTTDKYRAVQEFIAESWEKYHTIGGKGFSEAFQQVLEQITKAFQAVYGVITGTELTPELIDFFDEILTKQQQNEATQKENGEPLSEGVSGVRTETQERKTSPELRAEEEEVKTTIANAVASYYAMNEASKRSEKRESAKEFRETLEKMPTVKNVFDNIKTIFAQLESQGIITKSKDCP